MLSAEKIQSNWDRYLNEIKTIYLKNEQTY